MWEDDTLLLQKMTQTFEHPPFSGHGRRIPLQTTSYLLSPHWHWKGKYEMGWSGSILCEERASNLPIRYDTILMTILIPPSGAFGITGTALIPLQFCRLVWCQILMDFCWNFCTLSSFKIQWLLRLRMEICKFIYRWPARPFTDDTYFCFIN